MLETVDQIESSRRQRPGDTAPGEVAAALRALAFATSDAAAQDAYHRVLFAVGNDHAGSYFPIVLDAVPYLGEILAAGTQRSRARTLDVLIDLVGSFAPDQAVATEDQTRREDLPAFQSLMGLHSMYVHQIQKAGLPYVGFEFGCTWDTEHGLGALMHGPRVVEIGGADTAFLLWIAERDADER